LQTHSALGNLHRSVSLRSHRGLGSTAAAGLAALALATGSAPGQAPHDARQGEQWAVAPGTVLNLPAAWELSQGQGVTVAVIDSGARLEHSDLAPNVWVNFGEVPGNRVDDDANGYVDDVHGIDLTTSSRNRQDLSDGNGHGTHVAGIIAGASNGRGVVGVAFRARLMVVKVLDARGAGTTGAVAEGIRYAAANGARIINLSLGGPTRDPRLAEAVEAAQAANVLIVCSAGNLGQNVDQKPSYPVSLAARNLIGVAATSPTRGRELGSFSNFGRHTIGLAAPGVDVLSSANDGGWELKSGTSMAAPHAAGVAALMAAMRPDMSAAELRAELLQSAGRTSLPVGGGYLDALVSVVNAASASSYGLGQPPLLRVLSAQRKGSQTVAQIAAIGNTKAIARFRLSLDGRRVAELAKRGSPFTVRLRGRRGRKLRVDALDARKQAIASASRTVRGVKRGKRGVRRGSGVGAGQVTIR
jgi:subtilisin family serine protease